VRRLAPLALALAALAFAAPLSADSASPAPAPAPATKATPPLEISADKLEVDLEAKTGLLEGHVALARGDLKVRCPRVELRYDQSERAALNVVWARGSGGVMAELKGVRAEAPEVELDLGAQTLELRGGVKLSQGEGFMRAERAQVHLKTGKVSMTDVKGSIPMPKAPEKAP